MDWTLEEISQKFADVVPRVDRSARHDRWDPGIGPFEEEKQLEMILDELSEEGSIPNGIESEAAYPDGIRRVDLLADAGIEPIPIEAKLLRFRRDKGDIDPNMYASIFSPFPEGSSSSLLTDVEKMVESEFEPPYGLLGIYYEQEEEPHDQLRAPRLAEKLKQDIEFWYGLSAETVAIEEFSGLRHPHHQEGAIMTWRISES